MKRTLSAVLGLMIFSAGCMGPGATGGASRITDSGATDQVTIQTSDPVNPASPPKSDFAVAVLLFNGSGVSTSDWQTTETIVKSMGLSYQLVNSAQLDAMTVEEIASFGVIVVPGGAGGTIYQSVEASTRLKLRQAVRDHGVGYVGFCAGAWVAVGTEAGGDSTAAYGFAVAQGPILDYWYPAGNESATADMVDVAFVDGSHRQLVWWGGPQTPEWEGGVIARYADGAPAISEAFNGKGLVVISGPHPEAPQSWRGTAGADSDGLDYDIAKAMISAAIEKSPLPAE